MAGYVGIRAIPRAGGARGAQGRNEMGQFTEEVNLAVEESAKQIADDISNLATTILIASGYKFAVDYQITGGGTHYEVNAVGQFAEMAELGSPAHPIAPSGDHYSLEGGGPAQHSPGEFGPILPPGQGVEHPGTRDIHPLERAGEDVETLALGIVAAMLP